MDEINLETDKCIWSARLTGEKWEDFQCLPCFINTILISTSELTLRNIQIKHCFARGPYIPYVCRKCDRHIGKEKSIVQCPLCLEKCVGFLYRLMRQGIPVKNTNFLYDVHEDKLLYFHQNSDESSCN